MYIYIFFFWDFCFWPADFFWPFKRRRQRLFAYFLTKERNFFDLRPERVEEMVELDLPISGFRFLDFSFLALG